MAKIKTLELEKYSVNVLQEILNACERIDLKNELGIKDIQGGRVDWSIPELGYSSKNTTPEELKLAILESTNESSLRRAYAKIYELSETRTETPEYLEGTTTSTEAPEYEVSSNTLTPDQLAQLQKEAQARSEKIKQAQVGQSEAVKQGITKQQELYKQKIEQAKKAMQEKRFDKNVYVKKEETIDANPEEAIKVQKLIEKIKNTPNDRESLDKTIDLLGTELKSRLDSSVPDEAVHAAATYYVVVNKAPEVVKQIAIAKELSKTEDVVSIFADPNLSLAEMSEKLSISGFGKAGKLLTPTFTASESPQGGYEPISSAFIPIRTLEILDTQVEAIKKDPLNPTFDTRTLTEKYLAQIKITTTQGSVVLVHDDFASIPTGPKMTWSQMNGPNLLTTAVSGIKQKIGQKIISTGLKKIGEKVGLTTAAEAVGISTGYGAIVVAALKIWNSINDFVANHSKELKQLPLFLGGLLFLGTGLITGVPGLSLLGIGASGLGAAFARGATWGSIGSSIGVFFGALWGASLGAIGMPILVGLLSFPILVAIILVIINSGAYVVPPSIQSLGSENPYIGVTKSANPPGPFDNSDLPLTITYTITITAKKETLTGIQVKDDCKVINESGSQNCPAPTITILDDIAVGTSKDYTYQVDYIGSQYQDSLIINNATVTAKVVAENKPQTATAGTTITVGNPPTSCLEVDQAQWPSTEYSNIMYAVNTLIANYSSYIAKVCSSYPSLPLKFNASGHGNYWGWNHGSYIDFYSKGVNSQDNALYTLAHELGHSLAWGSTTSGIYQEYLAWPGVGSESPFCFYYDSTDPISSGQGKAPNAKPNLDESMQEAIAFYVATGEGISYQCASGGTSNIGSYSAHNSFLKAKVFDQ